MMPSTPKKIYLLTVFLVPIFFIAHVLNNYFGLIPFKYAGKFLSYYLLLALALYLIGRLIAKNMIKAVCWATFLLIIFFFWGAFTDFLNRLHPPHFFSSSKFLLSLAIIFILASLFILRKRKDPPVKLVKFLFILFSFFILMELVISLYKLSDKQLQKNSYAFKNEPLAVKSLPGNNLNPDIFFIVFDEYASSAALNKYLNFDNSALDSTLSAHHFYIAKGSKGNYNATPWSLGSTLSAEYFNFPLKDIYTEAQDLLKAQYTLKKSPIPVLLKNAGYEIKNAALTDLEDAAAPHEPLFDHDAYHALYDETLWARMNAKIGWMFTKRIDPTALPDPNKFLPVVMNTQNIASLYKELSTQSNTPKFVFGHMLVPHDPFYFKKDGTMRIVSKADELPGPRDSLYVEQLKYINYWIDSLANLSDRSFSRPRVVIIEGDHGRRDNVREKIPYVYEKQFMNLNSYYFSDHDYSMLYDSISPVNTFRVVLNKYFHTNLPLLKDSTILLH